MRVADTLHEGRVAVDAAAGFCHFHDGYPVEGGRGAGGGNGGGCGDGFVVVMFYHGAVQAFGAQDENCCDCQTIVSVYIYSTNE